MRALGYEAKGANIRTLQRWVRQWGISTEHFDPTAARGIASAARARPLEEVMVEGSSYPRGKLKRRLYAAGLKQRRCELCGQGEMWNGRRMALVLDHINGVSNDHRLENLQIVCPNCAATLDTHCGRNLPQARICPGCGQEFMPTTMQHRYCAQACWGTVARKLKIGIPQPHLRKVERPSYEQLLEDVRTMSFLAIGRKYGVSDNAVRKWIRWYERGNAGVGEAEGG
ncbi:MAG: HNH endonuclease signature motif containing protein [Solirubrobacteraceae bacterium]